MVLERRRAVIQAAGTRLPEEAMEKKPDTVPAIKNYAEDAEKVTKKWEGEIERAQEESLAELRRKYQRLPPAGAGWFESLALLSAGIVQPATGLFAWKTGEAL